MIQRKAVEKGCQQVLWLYGDDHYVTEVGTMNLFMFWINENGGLMAIEILWIVLEFRIGCIGYYCPQDFIFLILHLIC